MPAGIRVSEPRRRADRYTAITYKTRAPPGKKETGVRPIITTMCLVISATVALGEPPIFEHTCPGESISSNRICNGDHWDEYDEVCYTIRSPRFCPSGWENSGDCLDEFGIRPCASGERAALGLASGEDCATAYQECDDGNMVKCSQKPWASGDPYASWQYISCEPANGPQGARVVLTCIHDN